MLHILAYCVSLHWCKWQVTIKSMTRHCALTPQKFRIIGYLTESALVNGKRWLMSVYDLIVSGESFPHWWPVQSQHWPVCCGMEIGPHEGTWLLISISWNSAHIASNQWLGCRVGPSLLQSRLLFAHRQLWLPSPFLPLVWRTHTPPLSLADCTHFFFLFMSLKTLR